MLSYNYTHIFIYEYLYDTIGRFILVRHEHAKTICLAFLAVIFISPINELEY